MFTLDPAFNAELNSNRRYASRAAHWLTNIWIFDAVPLRRFEIRHSTPARKRDRSSCVMVFRSSDLMHYASGAQHLFSLREVFAHIFLRTNPIKIVPNSGR